MFVSDVRQPKVDFFILGQWSCLCFRANRLCKSKDSKNNRGILKGKKLHFRLTCFAPKRFCLKPFAVSQFLGKNRFLDQILLFEPFFGQLTWEWLKERFPTLRTSISANWMAAFLFFGHVHQPMFFFESVSNFFLALFFFHLPFFLQAVFLPTLSSFFRKKFNL